MPRAASIKNNSSAPNPQERLTGPQRGLIQLGLTRDIDRALHLPLRYEDETRLTPLSQAALGKTIQFEGEVMDQEILERGKRQLLVTVHDGERACQLRFFNFYPSHIKQMAVGTRLRVRGELRWIAGALTMWHPQVKSAGEDLPTDLTPVYPTCGGLPQAYLRKAIASSLERADLSETIAEEFLKTLPVLESWSLQRAIAFLHHPPPGESLSAIEDRTHPAWQRLKAEELLAQQLSQLASRRERGVLQAPALKAQSPGLPDALIAALPFTLTGAQARVSAEIARDLCLPRPMQRLLQGDVGSGKTIVAALAAATAIDAGWQCALMAPTEILAEQHFSKLSEWLTPLLLPLGKSVVWLTGGQSKKVRQEQLIPLQNGQAALVIGTHAVIGDQVNFAKLGLAVIDEQHRFGVAQRLELRRKLREHQTGGLPWEPHFLMMSATPIPRTLAMSYYADLDVSTLDELPPGRIPVRTKLIHAKRRDELIAFVRSWVREGRQIYWVCPLIEPNEESAESSSSAPFEALSPGAKAQSSPSAAQDLAAVIETQAELAKALVGHEVGLLHSKIAASEKRAVMERFTSGQMPVLVSTTVIEVGVDVPNASIMVIEQAERFGLAQLHQLRGRVGRGTKNSACILLYGSAQGGIPLSPAAKARLRAMYETNDGFEIARRDLAIRGPGDFLGSRQSGEALLRFADLSEDDPVLNWASKAAPIMLDQYPQSSRLHVLRWMGEKVDFLKA